MNDFDYAIKCLDKIFPFIPKFGHFNILEVVTASDIPKHQKTLIETVYPLIEQLLIENIGYAREFNGRYYLELTEKGREAKDLGGHFAYLQKQDRIKLMSEQKLQFDLKNAKRVYNFFWWTFGMAVIGLVISLVLLAFKIFSVNFISSNLV